MELGLLLLALALLSFVAVFGIGYALSNNSTVVRRFHGEAANPAEPKPGKFSYFK